MTVRYKTSQFPGEVCAAVCKRPPTCYAEVYHVDTEPDGTEHTFDTARMFFCTQHGRQHFDRFTAPEALHVDPETGVLQSRIVVTFPNGGSQTQYHLGGLRP